MANQQLPIGVQRDAIHADEAFVPVAAAAEHNLDLDDLELALIPLNIINGSFTSNAESIRLLERIGGPARILEMTDLFYRRYLFRDSVLDEFVTSHNDPHGARLGNYIVQKMNPSLDAWDRSKQARKQSQASVYDRTSAHSAAWRCPKRPAHRQGQRFKLDDARIWMRLMFAAGRDVGLFADRVFADWYTKFIGHFVAVYERSAQQFARESARWSQRPANVQAYVDNGYVMTDVVGVPLQRAQLDLGAGEREFQSGWPYR